MEELTNDAVEESVLQRVRLKASTYGKDPVKDPVKGGAGGGEGGGEGEEGEEGETYKVAPDLIMALYRDWVMPLTKEVQVEYLLGRLGQPVVAFVGPRRFIGFKG
jgi:chorismate mutase